MAFSKSHSETSCHQSVIFLSSFFLTLYIFPHTRTKTLNIGQKFPEAVNRNNYNTAFLDMITKLGTSAQIGLHELLLGFL